MRLPSFHVQLGNVFGDVLNLHDAHTFGQIATSTTPETHATGATPSNDTIESGGGFARARDHRAGAFTGAKSSVVAFGTFHIQTPHADQH